MFVEVRDLRREYGRRQVVSGLNFQIASGTVFGLIGPNGAGKSTTIRMIAGVLQPNGGSVRIAGLDLAREPRQAKRLIGLVPQELALYPGLSAHDNLAFWGGMHGLEGKELQRRIGYVLELVALEAHARQTVRAFSGGMQRRLNLAAGLLHAPKLLLLDEPTVGIDPQSRLRIFAGIEQLNREGMTILYSSHYLEEIERLCTQMIILDHGRLIASGTPCQLSAGLGCQTLEAAYLRLTGAATRDGDSA